MRNLYRELLPAVRADARIPAEDRQAVVGALERLRVDPWFLGGVKCYVEDADVAPMPVVRERVIETVKLAGDLPAEAVADIVVDTIERAVHRAKRTDREAAYHEIRTSGQRTRVAIDEARGELAGQVGRQHGEVMAAMQEVLDRLQPASRPATGTSAGQSDAAADPEVFALVALPTLFVLGEFTFVRLVELGIEDFLLGRAINRIRHYYLEHAGDTARYFMLSGNDDAAGVLGNMGMAPSPWQLYFTAAIAVAVVDAVIGGAAVALAVGIAFGTSLAVAVVIGAAAAVIAVGAAMRFQHTRREAGTLHPVLFPSDAP